MRQDLRASATVLINASVNHVWEALTNPTIIKTYLYGTNTETDWQKGSSIVFHGDYEGMSYRDHGIILENIPNELLSYSYWSGFSGLPDTPENRSTITYTLKNISNTETEFTWVQQGYADEKKHAHSLQSLPPFLDTIKAVVEKMS